MTLRICGKHILLVVTNKISLTKGLSMNTNKQLKLKRIWCFIFGILITLITQQAIKSISKWYTNWYNECDSYYGYKTDYYTCKKFHTEHDK